MTGLQVGMLWFDTGSPTELAIRLHNAIKFYQVKYGRTPNRAHVNPTNIQNIPPQPLPVETIIDKTVMPNHIWIGVAPD